MTKRIRLGLLVGANTFRNPGLTAKLATTMDHVSDGRAILGIGGAWFEREHDAYGFETWGSGFGERLDRLDESVGLMRRLLDGERIASHDGRFYHAARRPVRAASGPAPPADPDRRLRAEEDPADDRALRGPLEHERRDVRAGPGEPRRPRRALRRGRARPLRDRADRQLPDRRSATTSGPRRPRALERFRANGVENTGNGPHLAGPPSLIADAIAPYRELGFTTVFARLPAPYDRETIERLPELQEALGEPVATSAG